MSSEEAKRELGIALSSRSLTTGQYEEVEANDAATTSDEEGVQMDDEELVEEVVDDDEYEEIIEEDDDEEYEEEVIEDEEDYEEEVIEDEPIADSALFPTKVDADLQGEPSDGQKEESRMETELTTTLEDTPALEEALDEVAAEGASEGKLDYDQGTDAAVAAEDVPVDATVAVKPEDDPVPRKEDPPEQDKSKLDEPRAVVRDPDGVKEDVPEPEPTLGGQRYMSEQQLLAKKLALQAELEALRKDKIDETQKEASNPNDESSGEYETPGKETRNPTLTEDESEASGSKLKFGFFGFGGGSKENVTEDIAARQEDVDIEIEPLGAAGVGTATNDDEPDIEIGGEDSEQQSARSGQDPPSDASTSKANYFGGIIATDADDSSHQGDEMKDLEVGKDEKAMSSFVDKEVDGNAKDQRIGVILAVLCCLLVVVGAILLGVLLSDTDDEPSPAPPSRSAPTPAPGPLYFPLGEIQFITGEDYGYSLAVKEGYAAVGVPGAGKDEAEISQIPSGIVLIYQPNPNGDGSFVLSNQIEGSEEESRFGHALDFTRSGSVNGLVVGAPLADGEDTFIDTGAVYYFEFDSAEKRWLQLGGTMQGGLQIGNGDEQFGYSVATSDTLRVAIGAPNGNFGPAPGLHRSGQIYVFDLDQVTFEWTENTRLPGDVADAELGKAIGISQNGLTLAAGAPGKDAIYVFTDSDGDWQQVYEYLSPQTGVAFGTSIDIFDDEYIVAGGPDFSDGAGIVRIFEQTGDSYQMVREITGSPGDRLGERGTISLSKSGSSPALVLGTANGSVRRFDRSESGEWTSLYREFEPDFTSGVSSVGLIDNDLGTVVAASVADAKTAIFALSEVSVDGQRGDVATDSPTSAPTISPGADWVQVGDEPLTGSGRIGFGSSIALSSPILAVGAPEFGNGIIQTYRDTGASYSSFRAIIDEEGGDFGYAVDVSRVGSNNILVAGAPRVVDTDTNEFGAAYIYRLSNNAWNRVGNVLRPIQTGGEALFTAGGRFGHAVATADGVERVIVGAPRTSSTSGGSTRAQSGAAYIYSLDGDVWSLDYTINGIRATGELGTSVDISSDGTFVLVGAPLLSSGDAYYYRRTSSGTWQNVATLGGDAAGDRFGTTVAILNAEGSMFAVGAPSASSGAGVVKVYRRTAAEGPYEQVGGRITGNAGEALGATLSASSGDLVVGTSDGSVRVYRLGGSSWSVVGGELTTPNDSGVSAVAMSQNGQTEAVAFATDGEKILVYSR